MSTAGSKKITQISENIMHLLFRVLNEEIWNGHCADKQDFISKTSLRIYCSRSQKYANLVTIVQLWKEHLDTSYRTSLPYKWLNLTNTWSPSLKVLLRTIFLRRIAIRNNGWFISSDAINATVTSIPVSGYGLHYADILTPMGSIWETVSSFWRNWMFCSVIGRHVCTIASMGM